MSLKKNCWQIKNWRQNRVKNLYCPNKQFEQRTEERIKNFKRQNRWAIIKATLRSYLKKRRIQRLIYLQKRCNKIEEKIMKIPYTPTGGD